MIERWDLNSINMIGKKENRQAIRWVPQLGPMFLRDRYLMRGARNLGKGFSGRYCLNGFF